MRGGKSGRSRRASPWIKTSEEQLSDDLARSRPESGLLSICLVEVRLAREMRENLVAGQLEDHLRKAMLVEKAVEYQGR